MSPFTRFVAVDEEGIEYYQTVDTKHDDLPLTIQSMTEWFKDLNLTLTAYQIGYKDPVHVETGTE